jgi:hypothetical protein
MRNGFAIGKENVLTVSAQYLFITRCADKVEVEKTDAVCCSDITGCFRRISEPKRYIHVECAHFNPQLSIMEVPIQVDLSLVGVNECYICNEKKGICTRCCFIDENSLQCQR